jgi:hypothetical protein
LAEEFLSEPGAKRLAHRISTYWKSRGFYGIKTFVLKLDVPHRKRPGQVQPVYFVRSNIGPRGYPPRDITGDRAAFPPAGKLMVPAW